MSSFSLVSIIKKTVVIISGLVLPSPLERISKRAENFFFFLPIYVHAAAAKSLQSCPTLCNPIDGSPPGSSLHGIFQARVLEWGAIAFSSLPAAAAAAKSLQWCPTLCNPIDGSPPGSSVPGILQARILDP